MDRWNEATNPAVKVVVGFAFALFLALNFPAAFVVLAALVLSYAVALVAVAFAYRKRYGIVGKPELGARFAAATLAELTRKGGRAVSRGMEERERRRRVKQKKEARLRQYKRERNRRDRERAKRAFGES